jgi:6-phospho-beta-glucosidase
MKIAVIGGGSSYTPELMEGLLSRAQTNALNPGALLAVDPARLEIVTGFVRRMARARNSSLSITATTVLEEAVAGSAFAIAQIRVGGNAARREDELLGRRHGLLGQETTGVGGVGEAQRPLPGRRRIV